MNEQEKIQNDLDEKTCNQVSQTLFFSNKFSEKNFFCSIDNEKKKIAGCKKADLESFLWFFYG